MRTWIRKPACEACQLFPGIAAFMAFITRLGLDRTMREHYWTVEG